VEKSVAFIETMNRKPELTYPIYSQGSPLHNYSEKHCDDKWFIWTVQIISSCQEDHWNSSQQLCACTWWWDQPL